jgi:hypothetical protein
MAIRLIFQFLGQAGQELVNFLPSWITAMYHRAQSYPTDFMP